MAARGKPENHHAAPRCLISLHEKATSGSSLDGEGIQAWVEWEMEAMRWRVPVEIPREDLETLVASSEVALEREEHRLLHEVGNNYPNTIYGTAGNDTISGRGGGDRLSGFGGMDDIVGGAGEDLILGGADADNLRGGNGSDRILGGTGDDTVYPAGDDSADHVDCGVGFDTVVLPADAPADDRLVDCERTF